MAWIKIVAITAKKGDGLLEDSFWSGVGKDMINVGTYPVNLGAISL